MQLASCSIGPAWLGGKDLSTEAFVLWKNHPCYLNNCVPYVCGWGLQPASVSCMLTT